MNDELELMIKKLTSSLICSKQEKAELQLELRDHLYSAFEQHLESGCSREEATRRVVANFGQTDQLAKQYQQIVNPVFGAYRITACFMFIIYSLLILWKIIISRLVIRIVEYSSATNQYYNHLINHSLQNFNQTTFLISAYGNKMLTLYLFKR